MMMQKEIINLQYIKLFLILFLIILFGKLFAQKNVIDQIIATVDDKIILKSEIENELIRAQTDDIALSQNDIQGRVLENLLIVKLMVAQAKLDSVEVTEAEVERELDRRIKAFIRKAGTREKLEEYFNKTIKEIKSELRDPVRDYMLTRRIQEKITKDIKSTPSEVRQLARTFSVDSLPVIPTKLQVRQIVKYPKISISERERIRKKLRDIRKKIQAGENFSKLAVLYSEDPGSAERGGELGLTSRSSLVEEFANAAFNLKPYKISKIVETEYGFHIIQLIERKGDRINVRHILIRPKIEQAERDLLIKKLDTIAKNIQFNKISFENAVRWYSEDKKTRNNKGNLSNPITGIFFEKNQLPPPISQQIDKLKLLELSKPFFDNSTGRDAYKIIQIVKEIPEHKANLNEDWQVFEEILIARKKEKAFEKWINDKLETTYVKIDDAYKDYKLQYNWIK